MTTVWRMNLIRRKNNNNNKSNCRKENRKMVERSGVVAHNRLKA